jgi:hypothetical protein
MLFSEPWPVSFQRAAYAWRDTMAHLFLQKVGYAIRGYGGLWRDGIAVW